MKLFVALIAMGIAASAWGETVGQRFPALSPEQSLTQIQVPPGYHVELVASEPMIEEPVLCTWDGNGRMYVAEMLSYMQDPYGTGTKTARNGRIKRLEDTDGDGRMDKATVFIDGLLLPRIALPLDDRLIVQETDDSSLYSYRDTKGDGHADEKILMWQGPMKKNSVEHQDSSLTWNLDNWMYTTQGGTRFRFTRGKWEAEKCEAEFNQWGLGMDDVGTMFFSQNSIPGRGFQQPWYEWNLIAAKAKGRYKRPSLSAGEVETDEPFQHIYPINPTADRHEGPDESYTSACGISIYRGDAMPDLHGDMFLCEPCSHMIRRAKVISTNGKLSLRNAYDKKEFFASKDFYCRPVWTATGPDGCFYVVDMYRGIIQDQPWVGPEFVDRITRMGMDRVKRSGRIWRIAPDGFKHQKPPQLLDMKPANLVPFLAHPNGWTRDTAQMLIARKGDKSAIPSLQAMTRTNASPLARLHALWTLEGLDALDKPLLYEKHHDADPRVRAAAIRMMEPWLKQKDSEALTKLMELTGDSDVTVLRQLVLTLGWSPQPEAIKGIETIAESHLDNEIIYLATMCALWNNETPMIKRMLDGSAFKGIKDPAVRTATQQRWKAGIASWKGEIRAPRPLDAEAVKLVDQGATIFQGLCASCHAADGKGMQLPGYPKLAPPLDGSPRVLGQKERLARLVLKGMMGDVDGKHYEAGTMMPLEANDDIYIASVLTYIRQEWSNNAEPIRPTEVAAIRKATADRKQPWLLPELDRYAAPALTDKIAWKAYSGNMNKPLDPFPPKKSVFHTSNSPGHWFALDLGRPMELTAVKLDSGDDFRCPRSWEFRVSDDGKKWSEPLATGLGTGRYTTISFEPLTTRFIKITQTGQAIERWQISEVDVFGRTPNDATTSTPVSANHP